MYIPASLKENGVGDQTFAGCTSLSEFTVSIDNSYYKASSDKKMLLSKNGRILIAYPSASGNLTLDNPKITAIGNSAFANCTGLKTVSLPAATSIGERAFSGCTALTTVNLSKATTIGEGAFYGCTMLSNVACLMIEHIGSHAFAGTGSIMLYLGFGIKTPTLGTDIFFGVESTKRVRLYTLPSYSGYGPIPSTYTGRPDNPEVNWANGFRGLGWTGSQFDKGGYLNHNITVEIWPFEVY
jgi:hypothetical protein